MKDLQSAICELIRLKQEGCYWDYKREWHTNNSDLLHDILCFSNAKHKGDRYIIIGVDDLGEVIGVKDDKYRKRQHQLTDFLRDKEFSQNNRPEIEVRQLIIKDRNIDVIVIKDLPQKPFYITTAFQGVFAYQIYSRTGDTNTPKKKQCDEYEIEYMWRERFD